MAYSKIGFLASGGGGNPTGIGNYVNSLNTAGIPAVVMCNDGMVGISDALNTGGNHITLYRVVIDNTEQWSVPDYSLSPAAAANKHFNKLFPKLHPDFLANRSKVWWQPINEVDKNRSDWLGDFGVEFAKLANAQGFKVAMFAFSSGEPEPVHWRTAGMINYLKYCAANKEAAAVALHEYDYGHAGMQSTYPWHIGRFEELFKTCDENGIKRPYVLISEFGWSYTNIPDQSQIMVDVNYAAGLYAKYADVLGAAIWYLGPGFSNIANKVQQLIAPITNHTLTTTYPDPEPPEEPMPDNLLQNASFEEGWENQNGGHRPKLWRLDWKLDGGYVLGESQVKPQDQIPPEERPLFFVPPDETSWYMLKVFKNNAPIRPKLYTAPEQFIDLPAGKYRYSFYIYPDVYISATGNQKIWSGNPNDCRIRLYWNGVQGDWVSLHPYGGDAPRLIGFEWEHPGGPAQIGFQCDMPNPENGNNGFMTDAHDLQLLTEEPTMTLNEVLWEAAWSTPNKIINPNLGVWKKIVQNTVGYFPAQHEVKVTHEGVQYIVQAAIDNSGQFPPAVFVKEPNKLVYPIYAPEDEPDNPF